ncbi:MAG: hypothetical protein ACT4NL_11225 [Pseudomarimonas sp.]
MRKSILLTLSLAALVACSGGDDSGTVTAAGAAAPAKPASGVEAMVRSQDYDDTGPKLTERRYVDGMALKTPDGPAALLTTTPLDACTRLAVLARGNADLGSFATSEVPALVIVRNEEYPQGSVQLVAPGVTTYLSQPMASLQTDGDRLVAKGEEAGSEFTLNKPSLEYAVDLAYASMADYDAVAADSGPEAAWLRGLVKQAEPDAEATVTATFFEDENDYTSYSSRSTWFDVLSNWENFNVIAAASGPECATLVLQTPGFSGGSQKVLLRVRGAGDQRKVHAAESSEDHGSEGNYLVGRVEHPTLGAFPIIDARAENIEGIGTVITFSDKKIGDLTWEELVKQQRAARAVAGTSFGSSYMLSSLEFGGPGMSVESVPAEQISNAFLDETTIGGIINQSAPGPPSIVANFMMPLKAAATTP